MEPPLSGVNLQAKGLAGLPWEWHSLGKGLRSDGFHGNSTHVAQVYACATSCSLVDLHCISQQSSEHITSISRETCISDHDGRCYIFGEWNQHRCDGSHRHSRRRNAASCFSGPAGPEGTGCHYSWSDCPASGSAAGGGWDTSYGDTSDGDTSDGDTSDGDTSCGDTSAYGDTSYWDAKDNTNYGDTSYWR